jgi:hypothetical protein
MKSVNIKEQKPSHLVMVANEKTTRKVLLGGISSNALCPLSPPHPPPFTEGLRSLLFNDPFSIDSREFPVENVRSLTYDARTPSRRL